MSAFKQLGLVNNPIWTKFPCTIAVRVQPRKSGFKIRLIYVYPGHITLLEQMFLAPLLIHFSSMPKSAYCYALGNNLRDLSFWYSNSQRHLRIISIDYSPLI
jgi:hypothetical protein